MLILSFLAGCYRLVLWLCRSDAHPPREKRQLAIRCFAVQLPLAPNAGKDLVQGEVYETQSDEIRSSASSDVFIWAVSVNSRARLSEVAHIREESRDCQNVLQIAWRISGKEYPEAPIAKAHRAKYNWVAETVGARFTRFWAACN